MADESKPKSSASSSRDEERRAQREERRNKRSERLEKNSKASKKSASNKSSKISQEEQDAKDVNLGCCAKFAQFMAKTIHFIDGLIGLAFVIYGALIMNCFEAPAMEAVTASLSYGSLLLFASIIGGMGFATSKCWRVGLVVSAYSAPFIALFYMFVIITLLTSPDTFFDYLTEHKDVLYLNDAEIATIKQIMPFFYIVLASLAAIEICRFFGLRKIRSKLLRHDAALKRITSSERSNRSKSNRSYSNRTNLTEPLISTHDEEQGDESSDEEGD
ncbi:hypothetical protein ACHAXR_009493 [Thalassiosira sp. AJA248-18]